MVDYEVSFPSRNGAPPAFGPAPLEPPGEHWPLSTPQEGMLFQTLAKPESGCYVEQIVGRLCEPVDGPRLLESWNRVLYRHPMLRTCFRSDGPAGPAQYVMQEVGLPAVQEDWRNQPPGEQSRELDAFLREDRRRGFDMTRAPLFRLALFRLGESEYELVWTVHHILVDGRAINLLLCEVFEDYDGFVRSHEEVDSEEFPFGAYAIRSREELAPGAKSYWKACFEGQCEATQLPLPKPPKDESSDAAHGQLQCRLDRHATSALESFAAGHDLTLNIILLGAWCLLAHRYCDASDVIVGATKSVRHGSAELSAAIGPYINTLPVRTRIDRETALVPWLVALRKQWIDLRAFEHTPLDTIRACCDFPGDAPLYTMNYVFERQSLGESLRAKGGVWQHRTFEIHEHTPVPVMLAGYGGAELLLSLEYDRRTIAPSDASRMLEHLKRILAAMAAQPDCAAARLPMLADQELDWTPGGNHPDPGSPPYVSTPRRFEEIVANAPQAIALKSRDQTLTYAELNRRANQLARHLRTLGVSTDVKVCMGLPHEIDAYVALLAILKAGGVYVPVDPAYPSARIDLVLADSEARVLIAHRDTASRAETVGAVLVVLSESQELLAHYPEEDLEESVGPTDLAYIIYTSGSTGRPKGVCVAHGEAAGHFQAMAGVYGIKAADCVLQMASLSFDVSLEQIFVALLRGATVHLADDSMCFPIEFTTVIRECGISVLNLPPAFWQQWTEEGIARDDTNFGSQFRLIVVGSDVVPPKTVRQWQGHVDTTSVRLMNAYGPTETVITATCYEVPPDFCARQAHARVPIGYPVPGTELLILDQFLNRMPLGIPGELYIGGNRLARGYHNLPELTRERFIDHPFRAASGARLYRTGDRVLQRADGACEFLGRVDGQVKIRGFRIEVGEIEAILLHCEGVREALVLPWNAPDGDIQLIAYIVPHLGQAVDRLTLRSALHARLPDYMIPAGFVFLESFPVNVNGKVDRRSLPAPDQQRIQSAERFVAPRTSVEKTIARIWREVLHCGEVGIHDRFYDHGGHSLRAAHVAARIRSELGCGVTLGEFLQRPTIAALAGLLEQRVGREARGDPTPREVHSQEQCVVPMRTGSEGTPLFLVLGAGGVDTAYGPLVSNLRSGRPVYGLQYSHLSFARALTSVESIASHYLSDLAAIQPTGPYNLAGWSFGGLVAYEMACQLRERGEEIGLLALIDCVACLPVSPTRHERVKALGKRLRRIANRFKILCKTREVLRASLTDFLKLLIRKVLLGRAQAITLRDFIQFSKSNLVNVYALKQAGLEVKDVGMSRLDMMSDEFVRKVVQGLLANEAAARAYKMRPLDGTVTLLRTATGPTGSQGLDPSLGYAKLAASVDVIVAPGNHFSLVREPAVQLLASNLDRLLNTGRCPSSGAERGSAPVG